MTALDSLCPDLQVRMALSGILMDGSLRRDRRATDQAAFIPLVERNGTPLTANHYFNDTLENCRQKRMLNAMTKFSFHDRTHGTVVKVEDAIRNHPMSNIEHTVREIHGILRSYYKVARKRVVDNTIKYAADHFLITGPETPLRYFSPTFISTLNPEELGSIAGEASKTKRDRARLGKEIKSLEEASKILGRVSGRLGSDQAAK